MYLCYDKIIGLSDHDCECISGGRPADYNVSKSGLFLDGLTPISSMLRTTKCDKTIWDLAAQAVKSSITQFVVDTNALLGKRFKPKRRIVKKEVLGQIKSKEVKTPDKNYAVVRMVCCPVRGGVMKIRNIGALFASTGTIQVSVYNNVDGLLGTYPVETTANVHRPTTVNLELPLHSKYMSPLEYYFVYQVDSQNLPKDNELDCGCGGWTPTFNMAMPYYRNIGHRKNAPWTDYVMIGGAEINSLTELEDMPDKMSNDMYGLTFEVDFSCKVSEVLCEDSLDFQGNPLALSMAMAIQYGAAVKVADHVLSSDMLSRPNMVDRETWEENVIIWQEKYNQHTAYIASNADHTANDCLECRDVMKMLNQGLFS